MLDAMASNISQQGVAATSIQWGAWAQAGMAATDRSTALRLSRMGLGMISPDSGLQALGAALEGSHSAVLAAVPFMWPQFVAAAKKPLSPLFVEYASEAAEHPTSAVEAATAPQQDLEALQRSVQTAVASILGVSVGTSEPLMAAGLDSLGAVELRSSLESSMGVQLPSTLVFDYPTIGSITEFLGQKLGGNRTKAGIAGSAMVALPPAWQQLSLQDRSTTNTAVLMGTAWRSPHETVSFDTVRDAVGSVPLERWDVESDPLAARFGAYLADIAAFDAAAFGIPDSEAPLMDPQQRLLMETLGEVVLSYQTAAVPYKSRGVFVGTIELCF